MPVPDYLRAPLTMHEIAEQFWDLRAYPTQYVFSLLALISDDKLEKDKCIELSSPEGQEDWLNYCRRPRRTMLEVFHDFHKTSSKLTIEILFELFSSIKPRSFSIAGSCLPSAGRRLDLLVAVVKYYSKLKKPRLGLASNWLKSLNVGDRVYGWIKKGTLAFPTAVNTPLTIAKSFGILDIKISSDVQYRSHLEEKVKLASKKLDTPNILIGPGTGLAPFRSFLQERNVQCMLDKHTTHLFFGCRYKEKDYHCREELEKFVEEEKLTLYCAFSRDQEDKIYVQHKIVEYREHLWSLINNKNAYIFISGNSKNMPDNVREAFTEVFVKSGNLSDTDAKSLLNSMENSGRLQIEVW